MQTRPRFPRIATLALATIAVLGFYLWRSSTHLAPSPASATPATSHPANHATLPDPALAVASPGQPTATSADPRFTQHPFASPSGDHGPSRVSTSWAQANVLSTERRPDPDTGLVRVVTVVQPHDTPYAVRIEETLAPDGTRSLVSEMAADRLLALPDPAQIATFLSAVSAIGARAVPIIPDILYRVELTSRHADSVPDALAALSGVRYAEPDYIVHALLSPNDPKYLDGTLWGLHNTGQSSGLDDADIDAPEGWDTRHSAPDVIVGVIDTGVRYTHEDIAANMWINPGETGTDALGRDKRSNGIDDDGNGYVDDVHGINAITGTGNPLDD